MEIFYSKQFKNIITLKISFIMRFKSHCVSRKCLFRWFPKGPDRKKSVRVNTEFNRSVSVPVDKLTPRMTSGHSSAPNQTPTTPESDLASTPSLDCGDTGLDSHTERRNSSGTLLSPEADLGTETDGFYLLKKDSQRRTTLAKVLANDGNKICELWMQKVREKYLGETVLTPKHLHKLMDGLKAYVTDPSMSIIEMTLKQLKEELDYDCAAIHQLQFAIYLYQESVNDVLRLHPIKPHWMFALDNLVRSGVQAAITVLSPELGENLATHGSVDTSKSSKTTESFEMSDHSLLHLKGEHTRLCHECVENLKRITTVLKDLHEANKHQIELLRSLQSSETVQEEVEEDLRLANWLKGLGISERSQRKVLSQGYTLEEVLHDFSKDDIRRLKLLGAHELRIWKAIKQFRGRNGEKLVNGIIDSTETI